MSIDIDNVFFTDGMVPQRYGVHMDSALGARPGAGRVTIGDGATIGGNVWLLDDVPAGGLVVQPEATLLAPSASLALRDTLVAALV